ncbi:hypothetical protein OG818_30300 [Streptomyces virginiae]|uniref:hypothetical protein n=1 Tax=Streptomyces virginiae TaxID=1961 RepID=UPI00224E1DDF|nr:hypothetical protein [Streptomyces virginiae]MCX4720017.1 hypothetical protein [Streptomyces virginiae]
MSACSVFRERHGDPATWSAQTIDAYLDACLVDRDDCLAGQADALVGESLAKEATR